MTGQLTPYQEEVGKGLLRSCVELAMDGLQVSCCKSFPQCIHMSHIDCFSLMCGNLLVSQGSKI